MSKQVLIRHPANAYNKDIIAMTMPLFLMAVFYYGPRVLLLMALAWLTARLSDRVSALVRSQRYDRTDNSSVAIAFVILLMMPVTVRFRVVVAAVLVAVFIGKEAFGGYGHYPFNPAAVGFCTAAVSWPGEVFRFPQPLDWVSNFATGNWDALLSQWRFENPTYVDGPSSILRSGALPGIDTWNLLLGNYANSIGASCVLVVLACGVYLYVKGRLPLAAPLCYLGVIVLFAFIFPRYDEIGFSTFPGDVLTRLNVVKYEVFSGGLLFCGVFLVDEPVTLPKRTQTQVFYGLVLGLAVMMFRYFGSYELGACFAIILVNALSGYMDRAVGRMFPQKEVSGA